MSDVEVVIPAYDAGAHLGEAIASVRAQSLLPARIIVVDDGSRDATAEVARAAGAIEAVAHPAGPARPAAAAGGPFAAGVPVEMIRLGRNRGAAAARNAGLAATRAPWVAFLDADDRWAPRKLEMQCSALDADPALRFVLCRIREFVSPEIGPEERRRLQCDTTARDGWTASALLARRCVFDEVGDFPEALRVGEVIDWFSRARSRPHAVLDLVGVERRLHPGNSTRRAKVTGRDYLEVVRRHRARLRQQGQG